MAADGAVDELTVSRITDDILVQRAAASAAASSSASSAEDAANGAAATAAPQRVRRRQARARRCRIFCSSTFLDMCEDRARVNALVLPQLERKARERGLLLSLVDLQWGIPGGTPNDDILRTCLTELDRCAEQHGHALFLFLGGHRYGWAPPRDVIPADVQERYHWLAGASITAMEVLHGALRRDNPFAVFALRDYAFIESMPAEQRFSSTGADKFVTASSLSEQLALRTGIAQAAPDRVFYYNPALPDSDSGDGSEERPVAGWNLFAQEVERRVWSHIARMYPMDTRPPPSWRGHQVEMHGDYADQVMQSTQPRQHVVSLLLAAIDAASACRSVCEGARAVVLQSPSGAGKTSLMAAVAHALEERNERVLVHFCGGAQRSEEVVTLSRRIITELGRIGDTDAEEVPADEIPGEPGAAAARARQMLSNGGAVAEYNRRAGAARPVFVLIDAVNQLSGTDAAARLSWLPQDGTLDLSIIVVISVATDAHEGSDLRELQARLPHARTVIASPLGEHERRGIAQFTLQSFHKKLSEHHTALLVSNAGASSPVWLRLALLALRQRSLHEWLEDDIRTLPPDAQSLVAVELAAAEWKVNRPLVQATALLLTVVRDGLHESEAVRIIPQVAAALKALESGSSTPTPTEPSAASPAMPPAHPTLRARSSLPSGAFSIPDVPADEPLAPYYWARLRASIAVCLRYPVGIDDGLLTAGHGLVQAAIVETYGDIAQRVVRKAVANFFALRDDYVSPERRALELPFQLARLEDWPRLLSELCEPWAFTDLWTTPASPGQWEYMAYARAAGGGTYAPIRAALRDRWCGASATGADATYVPLLEKIGFALIEIAGYTEAFAVLDVAVRLNGGEDIVNDALARILALSGRAAMLAGDYPRAKAVLQRAVTVNMSVFGEASESLGLVWRVLGNTHERCAEYDDALRAYEKALAVRKQVLGANHRDVGAVLCNIGMVLQLTNQLTRASEMYKEALGVMLQTCDDWHPSVGIALNGLAFTQMREGHHSAALRDFERALAIRVRAYGEEHPLTAATMNNTGLVLASLGRYEDAVGMFERAMAVRIRVLGGAHLDVARSAQSLGDALLAMGELTRAEAEMQRALAIRQELFKGKDNAYMLGSWVGLATLHAVAGHSQEAQRACQEALNMYSRLKSVPVSDRRIATPFLETAQRTSAEFSEQNLRHAQVALSQLQAIVPVLQLYLGADHDAAQPLVAELQRLGDAVHAVQTARSQ